MRPMGISTEFLNGKVVFNNKSVNKQVSNFNETTKDIFSIKFWTNDFLKSRIK